MKKYLIISTTNDVIRIAPERIVYISDTDWHEHHDELHAMNIEEVIRKYAYEVVSSCI